MLNDNFLKILFSKDIFLILSILQENDEEKYKFITKQHIEIILLFVQIAPFICSIAFIFPIAFFICFDSQ